MHVHKTVVLYHLQICYFEYEYNAVWPGNRSALKIFAERVESFFFFFFGLHHGLLTWCVWLHSAPFLQAVWITVCEYVVETSHQLFAGH